MPYVIRNPAGKIVRVSVRSLVEGEVLPHSHPDVVDFLKSRQQNPKDVEETLAKLSVTDVEMSRAIEDLIMVLLKKNVIKMVDLPHQVQDRMALRTRLRARIEEAYEKASQAAEETPAN